MERPPPVLHVLPAPRTPSQAIEAHTRRSSVSGMSPRVAGLLSPTQGPNAPEAPLSGRSDVSTSRFHTPRSHFGSSDALSRYKRPVIHQYWCHPFVYCTGARFVLMCVRLCVCGWHSGWGGMHAELQGQPPLSSRSDTSSGSTFFTPRSVRGTPRDHFLSSEEEKYGFVPVRRGEVTSDVR
jgi:hypothetical protein